MYNWVYYGYRIPIQFADKWVVSVCHLASIRDNGQSDFGELDTTLGVFTSLNLITSWTNM